MDFVVASNAHFLLSHFVQTEHNTAQLFLKDSIGTVFSFRLVNAGQCKTDISNLPKSLATRIKRISEPRATIPMFLIHVTVTTVYRTTKQ